MYSSNNVLESEMFCVLGKVIISNLKMAKLVVVVSDCMLTNSNLKRLLILSHVLVIGMDFINGFRWIVRCKLFLLKKIRILQRNNASNTFFNACFNTLQAIYSGKCELWIILYGIELCLLGRFFKKFKTIFLHILQVLWPEMVFWNVSR